MESENSKESSADRVLPPDEYPEVHVYPVAEEDKHLLSGKSCRCEPRFEVYETGILIMHNRMV